MAIRRFWVSPDTLALYDERTNVKFRVCFPYADEPNFYSADELEDLIGHALEKFEAHCAEKPTHIRADKDFQHGLGETLGQIKESRERRQELGGPRYFPVTSV